MAQQEPATEVNPHFSDANATATPWATAHEQLEKAETFWLTTVRPDGRPHVTTVIAVWLDDTLYFCTGADERKAHNLEHNPHCVMTTGCNTLNTGLDVIVEGAAMPISDMIMLRQVAAAYITKYGEGWRFTVRDDGAFIGAGGVARVFGITPAVAFGFSNGTFSQTRWRF